LVLSLKGVLRIARMISSERVSHPADPRYRNSRTPARLTQEQKDSCGGLPGRAHSEDVLE